MPPKRNRLADRIAQSENIARNGLPVPNPCEYCLSHGLPCIMDSKSRNCASCTRRGRKCEKRFHSEKEWDRLKQDEEKLASELEETQRL
jgi:hypothetical protein